MLQTGYAWTTMSTKRPHLLCSRGKRPAHERANRLMFLTNYWPRPDGFEPPTAWFVARYSIQLSYGRGVAAGEGRGLSIVARAGVKKRLDWRRGWDSNPRWGISPYSLSRGAPSAARPPLRFVPNADHRHRSTGPAPILDPILPSGPTGSDLLPGDSATPSVLIFVT